MAYNDEALKAKLSTLNETQESIVSVSQWITFHRRFADRIAAVWLTRLRDSPPPKRLVYIYLVNDIVQNAKARKRTEFPNAFSPIIAEAVQQAYRSFGSDLQNKIKRVLDVWKSRNVFEDSILQAVQARIDDVDKNKSSGKKTLMGNSLFASSSTGMPRELESLGPLQTAISKAELTTRPLVDTAQSEYTKFNDPDNARPSPPVYAAGLSSLVKKLASAEAGLAENIKARKALIADLKRLTELNESALAKDESLLAEFTEMRTTEEANKREVEDNIMRGLAATPQQDDDHIPTNDNRPDVEELTPEPEDMPALAASAPTSVPTRNINLQGILAGFGQDEDASKSPPTVHTVTSNDNSLHSSKKRKLSHDAYIASTDAAVPDFGGMGVTGFDGTSDVLASLYATDNMAANQYNLAPAAPADASSLTTTLEQDVDALIQQGASNGNAAAG
ncbi:hypothetical protein H2198_005494 [Neophaeococcomyces mojaviensis]|uniref:Uncharacterized protein n=1 Tax=Neophaeococcomyces mojaviensis TaxID=3383035 RepID=A0ACC3A5H9_9EURO|nr:hypothetical protein H2198_005494 [Knufia sp. JES_112]